jgi:hypothetical protein
MAPSATEPAQVSTATHPRKTTATKPWVKSTGSLDQYDYIEVTPVIGREYPHVNLVSLLQAPNSEELLQELALTSNFSHPLFFNPKSLTSSSLPAGSRLLSSPRQSDSRLTKGTYPAHWSCVRETLNLGPSYPPYPKLGTGRLSCHRSRDQHHRF